MAGVIGTVSTAQNRLSALNPPQKQNPKMVTKADLAFVDAAIQLHRAAVTPIATTGLVGVDASNPVACDPVDVAAAVVAVAVLTYHLYNSCLIGEDISAIEALRVADRLSVSPTVSLDKLIEARNQLAGALGEKSLVL